MLRKDISEGGLIPRGYGVAFDVWKPSSMLATVACYPIPLNILARWGRSVWFYLKHAPPRRFGRLTPRAHLLAGCAYVALLVVAFFLGSRL